MKGMGRLMTTLLLAVGAAGACNGEVTETIGSETNWLDPCKEDADCAEGRCLCGVCTDECTTTEGCDGATTVCVSQGSEAYDAVCLEQTSAPEGGLCLEGCGSAGPCPVGSRCIGGACVPNAPPPTPADYVGRPCVNEWEAYPDASGSSSDQVTVEDPDARCDGAGYCLTYHFQGRSTCPYGGSDCLTPEGELVVVDVPPQLVSRPPETSMFCTCGCDGPPGTGPFCECPSGFSCTKAFVPLLETEPYPSHYCMPAGSAFDPSNIDPTECDPALANCEDR